MIGCNAHLPIVKKAMYLNSKVAVAHVVCSGCCVCVLWLAAQHNRATEATRGRARDDRATTLYATISRHDERARGRRNMIWQQRRRDKQQPSGATGG